MDLILALLGYAAFAMVSAPLLLTRGRWRMFQPRLALAAWNGAFLSGLAALALSLLLTLSLAMGFLQRNGSGGAGFEASAVVLGAWGSLGGFGVLSALVFTKAEPLNQGRRHTYEQLALIAAIGRYRTGDCRGVPVVFVDCAMPIATGIPGEDAQIVIASTIEEALSPAELDAVIAHEHAHLRMHHAWIAQLAHLNAVCLPWLRGAREFERATRLLIELIADDQAMRLCGPAAVRGALRTVGNLVEDEAMLLRAQRAESAHARRKLIGARLDRILQV